jgi:hypothetical protein
MTNGEEDRGPVTRGAEEEHIPIGRPETVMEGSRVFRTSMFLITKKGPMTDLFPESKQDALEQEQDRPLFKIDEEIALDGLSIRRMSNRKQCRVCGRGTRIRYTPLSGSGRFLKYRKCRRHMTATEKALLFLMLTEAEAGGLVN